MSNELLISVEERINAALAATEGPKVQLHGIEIDPDIFDAVYTMSFPAQHLYNLLVELNRNHFKLVILSSEQEEYSDEWEDTYVRVQKSNDSIQKIFIAYRNEIGKINKSLPAHLGRMIVLYGWKIAVPKDIGEITVHDDHASY